MTIAEIRGRIMLFLGDVGILFVGLWIALMIRYQAFPDAASFRIHIHHFVIVFFLWALGWYVAGLYDRFAFDFKKRILSLLIKTQIINAFVAIGFFYFLDTAITPKLILFIFLAIASVLVLLWRMVAFPLLYRPTKTRAVIICAGKPLRELQEALGDKKFGITIIKAYDLETVGVDIHSLSREIEQEKIDMVIFDYQHAHAQDIMKGLYPLIFKGIRFVQFEQLYELVFSRISIDHLSPEWFSQNATSKNGHSYVILKRIMDIAIATPFLALTAPFFPLVALCIRLESKGDAVIYQERIGKGGQIIRIPKFRSMTTNDQGVWLDEGGQDVRVTRVGSILRKSRIDELPQLRSVIKGDLSLVGPRPDIIGLGRELEKTIPYYTVRNLVAPGLSGWAQISQDKAPQSLEETILRLSYDLYYIKHRSFSLDIEIALKTMRILLSRTGA